MPYTTRDNTCTRSQYGILPQGMNNMSVYAISTYPGDVLGEAPCAWMQPVTPMNPTGDTVLYMGEVGAPSWIIDTDYETFAASYSCEEGLLGHIKNAAIATRDPSAPQEAVSTIVMWRQLKGTVNSSNLWSFQVDMAFDAFARNGIEMNDWYPVVHTEDCVYENNKDRWCKDV